MELAPEISTTVRSNDISGGFLRQLVLVFLVAYLLLFCGMSRRPGMYDEGIVLTGAMRVAAGQIPHRDFYFIYGPAEIYALAGLFKAFGPSLLVERLFDLLIKALLVTSVYGIVASYCRRSIAVFVSVITVLWLFGMSEFGLAITPVSLFNVVGSALLLPVFAGRVSTRRMLAAGAVSGAASLFRYDTGIALLGIHACVIAIAVYLRSNSTANRLRTFASTFWPYLLAFALLTGLPALYYFSVAPAAPLFHDIILFPGKYYARARNLPFPPLSVRGLENLGIYLPIAIAGVSLYGLVKLRLPGKEWRGFLITFGLLLAVMYVKGLVRVAVVQMYLAIIPSLLLIAVLYQHQSAFSRPVRIAISWLMWLSAVPALWSALHEIRLEYLQQSALVSLTQNASAERKAWCKMTGPLTRGYCFLPEEDRMHAIAFISSHTQPGQPLYVGLSHHDRIVANDNLIYFATQRLPATHWSHFDPDLQNRYDIQAQMVSELEEKAPSYIVLDSEFESSREPNDSAKSSGVTLLDDYIHDKYQPSETFGTMSIWRRRPG
jgi:hypothetical protein